VFEGVFKGDGEEGLRTCSRIRTSLRICKVWLGSNEPKNPLVLLITDQSILQVNYNTPMHCAPSIAPKSPKWAENPVHARRVPEVELKFKPPPPTPESSPVLGYYAAWRTHSAFFLFLAPKSFICINGLVYRPRSVDHLLKEE